MSDPLMSREEVAAFLGISPESVRKTLARYDIHEQRGYSRDQVEQLHRPGKGWRAGQRGPRTDDAKQTPTMPETPPTQRADSDALPTETEPR